MDIWREGRYIDLWSIVHFLSGVVFAGWMLVWGWEHWLVFAVYFVGMVIWEIFEHKRKIHEHMPNKFVDILAGALGFISIFVFLADNTLAKPAALFIFTFIFLAMNLLGFLAYKKRMRALV